MAGTLPPKALGGPIRRVDPAALLETLQEMIRSAPESQECALVLEMIQTATKLLRDGAAVGDLKVLNHVLKELRYAFKVFAPYRRIRKVSVFGSARTPEAAPEFEHARRFANRMTRIGWMVITGAAGGIMEAAQGGAGKSRSFGVNIRLPFEQKANTFIAEDPKLINFKYFFARKFIFVKETDAIALFPGGFGTHDEGFESLTLIQTGKSHLLPIVFVDRPGGSYWQEWRGYIERQLCDRGYIDRDDLSLFRVTEDVDAAVETIATFYRNYHSARFVRGRLVLRLDLPVSDSLLDQLNGEFSDMLSEGVFERLDVHRDEANEPETHHLWRLGFWFNRRSFGRLRQLVDVLNRLDAPEE